jgi:hypothetical protein
MVLLAALAATTEAYAADQVVLRDDFTTARFAQPTGDVEFAALTYLRDRNPNGLIEVLAGGGVRLTVKKDAYRLAKRGEGDLYDRAELREAKGAQLPAGSAVWYRFSMRVPPEFPRSDTRLVAAQLKASYAGFDDVSPAFAIRIENRQIFATVEQSYDRRRDGATLPADRGACPAGHALAAAHGADSPQLRVLLAADGKGPPPRHRPLYAVCARGAIVENPQPLPIITERPIEFLIFIRTGSAGRVELYADGRLSGVATGRFGDGDPGTKQYFKIGPYRDKADEPAALEFTGFRRGVSRQEVSD